MIKIKYWYQYVTNLSKELVKKLRQIFFLEIFWHSSLTQLLCYAVPSYVGIAPGFVFLWVSEDVALGMTSNDLNKVLVAICNRLNKKIAENYVGLHLKYFRHSFLDAIYYGMPGHITWELRLNSCIYECQRAHCCHPFGQSPARHDLWWFGEIIAHITHLNYQKKVSGKLC